MIDEGCDVAPATTTLWQRMLSAFSFSINVWWGTVSKAF